MSGQVISFAMSDRGGSVGVGGEVVEFCESIVRALGHGVLRAWGMFGCNHFDAPARESHDNFAWVVGILHLSWGIDTFAHRRLAAQKFC